MHAHSAGHHSYSKTSRAVNSRGANSGIIYYKPTLSREDIRSVMECMVQDEISTGNVVANYENEFAAAFQVSRALATISLSAGYHLSLVSFNLPAGSEVIMPATAPMAALDAVHQVGAVPVLVDIARASFHPDCETILEKITEKTGAVLLHYPYGSWVDYSPLYEKISEMNKTIAKDVLAAGASGENVRSQIFILEDISYIAGAETENQFVGSRADISIVGLHEDMLMTIGKGAMVLTENKKLFTQMKDIRTHGTQGANGPSGSRGGALGENRPYRVRYDYTITDYQAAMGLEQLSQLQAVVNRRKKIGQKYQEAILGANGLETSFRNADIDTYGGFPVMFDKPEEYTTRYFKSLHIETRRTLPFGPLHDMMALADQDFPNTRRLYDRGLMIPLYPNLTKNNVDRIISAIRGFY